MQVTLYIYTNHAVSNTAEQQGKWTDNISFLWTPRLKSLRCIKLDGGKGPPQWVQARQRSGRPFASNPFKTQWVVSLFVSPWFLHLLSLCFISSRQGWSEGKRRGCRSWRCQMRNPWFSSVKSSSMSVKTCCTAVCHVWRCGIYTSPRIGYFCVFSLWAPSEASSLLKVQGGGNEMYSEYPCLGHVMTYEISTSSEKSKMQL